MRRADRETLRFERSFSAFFLRSLKARLLSLAPTVRHILETKHVPEGGIVVPGSAEYRRVFAGFIAQVFAAGQTAGAEYVRLRTSRRTDHFADPVPIDAITFLRNRVALQGAWGRSLDADVTKAIIRSLERGYTVEKTMEEVARIFPNFTGRRLATIARNETMTAYNQGALAFYTSPAAQGFVVALKFNAVLDDRTTPICRPRDGLVMMITDPRLPRNTPQLHHQCRSIWQPITKMEFRRLGRTPAEVAKDWDNLPPPQEGFGGAPVDYKPGIAPTITPEEASLVLQRASEQQIQEAATALGIEPDQVKTLLRVQAGL